MADILEQDAEFDPSLDKESSKAWLNLIEDAEKAFQDYQDKSDNIDKLFANLNRLANATRDREFNIFWANIQVLGPSMYSRPPVPVVVPRFRSRNPIARTASEMLERDTTILFEITDIDSVMKLLRDDLARLNRGCAWLRYEAKEKKGKNYEKVCIEHVSRRDWLCSPARKWSEVDWVARRAWMTAQEMKDRFHEHSGDAYTSASFTNATREEKDKGNRDPLLKAGVWEIWCKSEDRVVWVTEGVDEPLDSDKPHLKLDGFFPCPKPVFGTVQPDSLVPVPDFVYYKDQLEEINELTGRIAALSEAIKVKGFYASGAEIGDAVETAMKTNDNGAILVPISNWAAFGQGGDPIIWLPVDMIAKTVAELVGLRKQLIDDVYQITGLSDIMRGTTNANETLGAQELKSQYGSVRIRDRQDELVRVARDMTRIAAEIMAENFSIDTLMDMSQMELPSDADIKKQLKELSDQRKGIEQQVAAQIKQAQSDPQLMAQAQQNPEQAQQMLQQLQGQAQEAIQQLDAQAQKISETVTKDQVKKLLDDQRLRPFVLDIETDSTIAPDENAQKQRATEFITAVGGFLNQAIQAVQVVPQSAPLMADTLKYVASQFRAGRELDATIDEFAENMKAMGQQQKADPAADAARAEAEARTQTEAQKMQMAQQQQQFDQQLKAEAQQQEIQIKQALAQHEADLMTQDYQIKAQATQLKAQQDYETSLKQREKLDTDIALTNAKIQQAASDTQNSAIKTATDVMATQRKAEIAAQPKPDAEGPPK
jgi:hypothetical protein